MEVCPIKRMSWLKKECAEVNRISMHHPVRPQMKKFFFFIKYKSPSMVRITKVCPEMRKNMYKKNINKNRITCKDDSSDI